MKMTNVVLFTIMFMFSIFTSTSISCELPLFAVIQNGKVIMESNNGLYDIDEKEWIFQDPSDYKVLKTFKAKDVIVEMVSIGRVVGSPNGIIVYPEEYDMSGKRLHKSAVFIPAALSGIECHTVSFDSDKVASWSKKYGF